MLAGYSTPAWASILSGHASDALFLQFPEQDASFFQVAAAVSAAAALGTLQQKGCAAALAR